MTNISAYIETVATHYWGEPRERKGNELRWGNHGSKSVDLRKGTWFDFENNEGGGVVDLVRHEEGATLTGLPELMEKKFGIQRQVQDKLRPAKYISKVYDYVDENGEVTYQVVRYEPKTFRQRRPDGNGGWLWNMQDVQPVPYNLPDIMAKPDKPIFIVEGEKCADTLKAMGAIATTSHGGAKKWAEELNKYFTGRDVIILPDNDEPGKLHADMVSNSILPVANTVKVINLPGLQDKQDVYDWFKGGGTTDKLVSLVKDAEVIHLPKQVTLISSADLSIPDTFEIYDINYLRRMPPVDFVVDNLLTKHGLAVLYGEPGAGKSFLAIDLALCMAYGKAWHGNPVEQGAVLYIAGEGVGGLGKRVKAWQSHYQMTDEAPFYVLPTAVRFREPEDIERLLRTIDALGQTFTAVYIDTVARALLGGDENSSTDMGLFVDACEVVKRHCNCAVVAIHHSGKDAARGMRGSTALLGAVDTSIRVSKLEETVTMAIEKQKDAEPIPDMTFEMQTIALLGDASVVMKHTETQHKKTRQVKLTSEQQIAMQALRNLCATMGQTRVPVSLWHEEHRVKTPDVTSGKRRDARAALQNKGVIVIDDNKVWEYKEIDENV